MIERGLGDWLVWFDKLTNRSVTELVEVTSVGEELHFYGHFDRLSDRNRCSVTEYGGFMTEHRRLSGWGRGAVTVEFGAVTVEWGEKKKPAGDVVPAGW